MGSQAVLALQLGCSMLCVSWLHSVASLLLRAWPLHITYCHHLDPNQSCMLLPSGEKPAHLGRLWQIAVYSRPLHPVPVDNSHSAGSVHAWLVLSWHTLQTVTVTDQPRCYSRVVPSQWTSGSPVLRCSMTGLGATSSQPNYPLPGGLVCLCGASLAQRSHKQQSFQ